MSIFFAQILPSIFCSLWFVSHIISDILLGFSSFLLKYVLPFLFQQQALINRLNLAPSVWWPVILPWLIFGTLTLLHTCSCQHLWIEPSLTDFWVFSAYVLLLAWSYFPVPFVSASSLFPSWDHWLTNLISLVLKATLVSAHLHPWKMHLFAPPFDLT